MSLLQDINNINQPLKNITYVNDSGFHKIRLEIGSSIYEFKYDSHQNCCEKAYFLSYPYYKYSRTIENTLIVDSSIINKTISRISFYSDSDRSKSGQFSDKITYKVEVSFVDENDDTIYTLLFNNTHNGYYPRTLFVNLYENNDEIPIKIFNTHI